MSREHVPGPSGGEADPLLANQDFVFAASYAVLGFPLRLETNNQTLLAIAAGSWPGCDHADKHLMSIRLGVSVGAQFRPLAPTVRGNDRLLSIIVDAENFLICDLEQQSAFGWIADAALRDRSYLRYYLLEAAAMCLLSTSRATPVHAACVSLHGIGLLLCGESGAGKSTLAYACARAGWTFTSDDACYLLWQSSAPQVRGNARQIRFRPSACSLFPEIGCRNLTERAAGKPSIEVPTHELRLDTSQETGVDFIVFLDRRQTDFAELTPLSASEVRPYFARSLFASGTVRKKQAEALRLLERVQGYRLVYGDLDSAISCLAQLTTTHQQENLTIP